MSAQPVAASILEKIVVGVERVGMQLLFLENCLAQLELHHLEHGGFEVELG